MRHCVSCGHPLRPWQDRLCYFCLQDMIQAIVADMEGNEEVLSKACESIRRRISSHQEKDADVLL